MSSRRPRTRTSGHSCSEAALRRRSSTRSESRTALAQHLWAEIRFPRANPPPPVPPELTDRFDWTYDTDARDVRFSCRGFVDAAAFNQVPLAAQRRTRLRRRYELVRDIIASQIARVSPRLSFTFPTPAPGFTISSPAVPADFASFLAYDAAHGRLELTGFITQAQGTALKVALDPSLAPGIDDLVVQSNSERPAWIEGTLALDILRNPDDPGTIARGVEAHHQHFGRLIAGRPGGRVHRDRAAHLRRATRHGSCRLPAAHRARRVL